MTESSKRLERDEDKVKRMHERGEKILAMKEKGYSNAAIAHEMGLSESTVRQVVEFRREA